MGDIKLNSVNFEHGMLLTPDHFLRQEQYFDSALHWLVRYATRDAGLVGAGPRLAESEQGAVRHDPIVNLADDGEFVTVSVTQCRGLSPSGCIVDIDPACPVVQRFARADMEGSQMANVYVVAKLHEKQSTTGVPDDFNPQMQTERRPQYQLSLQVPPQHLADSLIVARLRKARYGAGYERDAEFIPPCTLMMAHSELAAGARRITEEVTRLFDRYIELHRAMQEFLLLFKERGIDTEIDTATMAYVNRMVMALEQCTYELVDQVQSPRHFFLQLRRLFHTAAVYLDLNPQLQGFFETLRDAGETQFVAVLEQQRRTAHAALRRETSENLATEIQSSWQALNDARQLERALEGKYLDFRINRALEAMNFIFDRGGKVLYRLAAKPARVQGVAADLIITFSQLRLEGREKYRLILVGDPNATFEPKTRIDVEIRINEGSGFRREPILLQSEVRQPEQCNFEYDFDSPDVPTITDLRVIVAAHFPIQTALLFVRQRFYAASPEAERGPARELRPTAPLETPPPPTAPVEQPPYRGRIYDYAPNESREPARDPRDPRREPPPRDFGREGDGARRAGPPPPVQPPWETSRGPERPPDTPEPPYPPPRRRRLE